MKIFFIFIVTIDMQPTIESIFNNNKKFIIFIYL